MSILNLSGRDLSSIITESPTLDEPGSPDDGNILALYEDMTVGDLDEMMARTASLAAIADDLGYTEVLTGDTVYGEHLTNALEDLSITVYGFTVTRASPSGDPPSFVDFAVKTGAASTASLKSVQDAVGGESTGKTLQEIRDGDKG